MTADSDVLAVQNVLLSIGHVHKGELEFRVPTLVLLPLQASSSKLTSLIVSSEEVDVSFSSIGRPPETGHEFR